MKIPFNRPLVLGDEQKLISEVFANDQFAGKGKFSAQCQQFLEDEFRYKKALLTTSCTSALELASLLLDIAPGDEVIVPSYAFITTANAFASKGAKVVFADSRAGHPSIDENEIEQLITPKTKAIIALHYGGVACEMDSIMQIAKRHSIAVIEDNAQGIGSTYKDKFLGGIGDIGALSFHESKNVHCGEGGAISINNDALLERVETLWDMGTNRADFKKGKVNSYGWVDVGSSFYPSELNAAFLSAQLPTLHEVNKKRNTLWNGYYDALKSFAEKGKFELPKIPSFAKHNGHIFYLMLRTKEQRNNLIQFLSEQGISSAFHFQSLHRSPYFASKYKGAELVNADKFSDRLLRLPLYHALNETEQEYVIDAVGRFFAAH
ncbi:MAG: dTDP-4-amino-4,6-dideoxygalactose transaminase [Flavobacteriales bacterium]|nr:dTDP-4-amino-4,6-dideoxygalactose transaminase [Flavobacteriales bacterium]